jgi:serine/threonine protein phosphatase PrpC
VRSINEDAVSLRPEIGLWAVADGMGGHEAGEIASALVIQALSAVGFPSSLEGFIETIKVQLENVNTELVLQQGAGKTGTTVVVFLAHGDRCACLWVGDSRLYRLRNDMMHAMTRDHSYVQELVQAGQLSVEDAETHSKANVITRAIGAHETIEIEIGRFDLKEGDRYLLCSDGLYREITEQELFHHMSKDNCNLLVDTLLRLTLDRGARDNVSIVAVDFVGE